MHDQVNLTGSVIRYAVVCICNQVGSRARRREVPRAYGSVREVLIRNTGLTDLKQIDGSIAAPSAKH